MKIFCTKETTERLEKQFGSTEHVARFFSQLAQRMATDPEFQSVALHSLVPEFDELSNELRGLRTRLENRAQKVAQLETELRRREEEIETMRVDMRDYREANGGLAKDVERLKQAHKPAPAATPDRAEVERLRAALIAAQDRIKALEAAAEADPDVDADMIMRAAEYLLAQRLNPARLALAIQQEVFSLRMQFADPKRLADGLSEAEVEQVIDGVNQRIVDVGFMG